MPERRRLRAVAVGTALALLVALFSVDYTVERGDTLGKIAKEYEVSVSDLVEANNISNPNLIRVGQVLVIPGQEPEVEDVIHVVVRGDTLGKIAAKYDTDMTTIIETNGIANPNLIRIGQRITVPDVEQVSTPPATPTPADPVEDEEEEGAAEEPENEEIVHVVSRGETLARIASKYGVSLSAITSANGISNPNLIRSGQKLVIRGGGSTQDHEAAAPKSTNTRSGAFHVVKKGEKLASIANRHGISESQLASANGIINGVIYVTTRLFLDGPGFVAEPVEGSTGTYTVKSGDRLGDIAATHGTTISKIAEASGISNVNLIRSGQKLVIPGGGAWVCPVDDARFFNDWGFPRSGGRFHEGNDLFAPYGTPVYAPVSGTVKFKTGSVGGKQFNLIGDDGVFYLGSHMSAFGKDGPVNAGDVVGYIGTSGNAVGTRPHLHFGMYLEGGTVINPYPSLIENGCR